MSELALASRRANLAKARAAPKEKIYRPTEKRQAASRANMALAIAARKSPRGKAAARMNALRYGLFAKDAPASVRRLGEDMSEYRNHHAIFERVFAPQDEEERRLVRRLADSSWKRLRFLRAQAAWELARLKKALQSLGPPHPLSAEETRRRAFILAGAVDFNLNYLDYYDLWQSQIQSGLRQLLKKRSGGKIRFRVFRRMRSIRDELDMSIDDWLDRALKVPRDHRQL